MTANPGQRIQDIPLLSDRELQTVIHDFNSTGREFANLVPVHRMVEQQAAATPDAMAIEDPAASGARLSYAELNQQANRLAHALLAQGVDRGQRVAISCERSVAMAVASSGRIQACIRISLLNWMAMAADDRILPRRPREFKSAN